MFQLAEIAPLETEIVPQIL